MSIYEVYMEVLSSQSSSKIITRKEIIELIHKKYKYIPSNSILPSDFCYNSLNKGIKVEKHKKLFWKEGYGKYSYKGPHFDNSNNNPDEFVKQNEIAQKDMKLLKELGIDDCTLFISREESCQDADNKKYYDAKIRFYARNEDIAKKAKERANGICQLCNKKAPFKYNVGNQKVPCLEAHHVIWLSKGGKDDLSNIVALCPNCHKKVHLLADQKDIEYLQNILNNRIIGD